MCAGVITWLMIIGYFIVLIALGIYCLNSANSGNTSNLPSSLQSKATIEAIGYTLLSIAGISLIIFLYLFNKIRRAIAIMKAASDFTRDVC
jgi:solute carrier family 44 (choline transporter-like protein), member 2/4/5